MDDKQNLQPQAEHDITPEELENEQAVELRDREAMSLVNANLAAPVNAAVALNALSDNRPRSRLRIRRHL
jgi:hypothetical protein